MDKPHYVIYIPGLGDDTFGPAQKRALKLWKIYGMEVYYFPVDWGDKEAFEPKLQRVLANIDEHAVGNLVSLIGVSAGASAAINAYAARKDKIHRVVCVCGKLRNPQAVHPARFAQNPAFKDSLDLLPGSLFKLNAVERNKILSARPITDRSVPPADTVIEGAHSSMMPTFGHFQSIAYALTIGSFKLSRFIKKTNML